MRGNCLLLLLLVLAAVVRGDLFHYYKVKKFLTAVAFARALGKRPTILPVPIPIPIPISQNEVVRIPASSAKTFLNLRGVGSQRTPLKVIQAGKLQNGFIGSSNFGYPLAGSYDSQMGGDPNVVVLNNDDYHDDVGGSDFGSPSNVIRLVSSQPRRIYRKPRRQIVITGGSGRTMRVSENIEYVDNRQSRRRKVKRKRPIPVGEKFRLP